MKVKKYLEFIREFVENSTNIIDSKMSEIKDLVDGISGDDNLIVYEWENKMDHELIINFTFGDMHIRYEFDIDDLKVSKIVGDSIDFTDSVESIDEGLSIIEKDIHMILNITESKVF